MTELPTVDYSTSVDCENISDELMEAVKDDFRQSTFTPTETFVLSTFYTSIAVAGVLGNGLVILAVLSVRRMRTVTNIFIANMSVANFIFAAILVPFMWLPYQSYWPYGSFLCKQVSGIAGVNLYCSAFTIVACAADRFYTISTRSQLTRLTKCYACGVILSIWVAGGVFTGPYWLYYEVTELNLAVICRPDIIVMRTCDLIIPKHLLYAVTGVQLLFLLPVPLLSLLIFNAKLASFLRTHLHKTESLRHRQTNVNHRRVTILLFTMTTSYAVLWIPFLVFVAMGDISGDIFLQLDSTGKTFQRIQVALHLLSSASVCINPLLYGFLNSNFRSAFLDIWYCVTNRSKQRSSLRNEFGSTNTTYGGGKRETLTASAKQVNAGESDTKERLAKVTSQNGTSNLHVNPYALPCEDDILL